MATGSMVGANARVLRLQSLFNSCAEASVLPPVRAVQALLPPILPADQLTFVTALLLAYPLALVFARLPRRALWMKHLFNVVFGIFFAQLTLGVCGALSSYSFRELVADSLGASICGAHLHCHIRHNVYLHRPCASDGCRLRRLDHGFHRHPDGAHDQALCPGIQRPRWARARKSTPYRTHRCWVRTATQGSPDCGVRFTTADADTVSQPAAIFILLLL